MKSFVFLSIIDLLSVINPQRENILVNSDYTIVREDNNGPVLTRVKYDCILLFQIYV